MPNTLADAPKRRTGHGTLSMGMLAIPVDFYTALDDKQFGKVSRSLRSLHTGNPIKYKNVDAETGDEVPRGEQYKVVDVDGVDVAIDDEELLSVLQPIKGYAEILGFLAHQTAAESTFAIKHFQVRPHRDSQTKSVDPGAAKAWAVLMRALQGHEAVAIIKLAMRDHVGFYYLDEEGDMAQVAPINAVRRSLDMPEVDLTDEEIQLGHQLVGNAMRKAWPPLYDDGIDKVMAYARDKRDGKVDKPMVIPLENRGTDLVTALTAEIKKQQEAKGVSTTD